MIVNLPPGRDVDVTKYQENGRVFLFNGNVRRQKLGHTLLLGHLECFDVALREVGEFAHFCTLASNSLLVRRFDRVAAAATLQTTRHVGSIDLDNLPELWWWPTVRKSPDFIVSLKQLVQNAKIASCQIEGLFAARDDWAVVHAKSAQIGELGLLVAPDALFPFEEILPATFFVNGGSAHYIQICHVFWERTHEHPVTINDLAEISTRYPAHIFAMKWFERDPDNVETALVSQSWSRDLLAQLDISLRTRDLRSLATQRRQLERLAAFLREFEAQCGAYSAFNKHWAGISEYPSQSAAILQQPIQAARQWMQVYTGIDAADRRNAVFLYLENTQDRFHLEISIWQGGRIRIEAACAAPAPGAAPVPGNAGVSSTRLEGYVYISPLQGGGNCTFRMRVPSPCDAEQGGFMDQVVLAHDNRYTPTPVWDTEEIKDEKIYYFRHKDSGTSGHVWFGAPIFLNTSIDWVLEVMLC